MVSCLATSELVKHWSQAVLCVGTCAPCRLQENVKKAQQLVQVEAAKVQEELAV